MQDSEIKRMMRAPATVDWFVTVILDQARQAHVSNHHGTRPNGTDVFDECGLQVCKLARHAYVQLEKLGGTGEPVVCPQGHSEYITQLTAVSGEHGIVFHCDDCHQNFLMKPEAKPFGGQSRSEFQGTLARYVREQSQLHLDNPVAVMALGLAAAIIDPKLNEEDWQKMAIIAGVEEA